MILNMACIFLTNEIISMENENYGGTFKDIIAIDINSGDYHIICRGQWQGKNDNLIINNDIIHIFSRKNKKDRFTYLGIATKEYIIGRISPIGIKGNFNELTIFKLIIKSSNVINATILNRNYIGSGCLKKACLSFLGLDDFTNTNITHCFIKL